MFELHNKTFHCPIELTLHTIMGKWKAVILWQLVSGKKRNGELKKNLIGINHKMLTQQLRELEEDGIILRTVHRVVPPKVEYELTELGEQIKPILESMLHWGILYSRENKEVVTAPQYLKKTVDLQPMALTESNQMHVQV